MSNGNTPDPKDHPVVPYLDSVDATLRVLIREEVEQEDLRRNGKTTEIRQEATTHELALEAEIRLLADERNSFLVSVLAFARPPSEELVKRSVQLAKDVAAVTVARNRPAILLAITSNFFDAATAIKNGQVPPKPKPVPAPEPPAPK